MDLTRQFVTSYPVIRRGGPLQHGFPVVGGLVPGGPGLHSSAVATPSAGASSPGAASSSPPERRRAGHASPRAPAGCSQPPQPLPQTNNLLPESTPTPMPLCANLFSPTTGPQLSKHLNFGWADSYKDYNHDDVNNNYNNYSSSSCSSSSNSCCCCCNWRMAEVSGDIRESSFLFQRLSLLIQRFKQFCRRGVRDWHGS